MRRMVLPVSKLATLAVRTISKPIASRLKKWAAVDPKFRSCIINIAQINHRWNTTMQRRLYGYPTDNIIRLLNEERAVHVSTELLGELFVFSVAGAAIIYEWKRGLRSEARKEESRKQELQAMKKKEEALEKEVMTLKQKISELETNLARKW